MRIRSLPIMDWDVEMYNPSHYGEGTVDIFIDEECRMGERVNCLFRMKDIEKYENDKCHDETLAILCNDCGVESEIMFLQGLQAGQVIPVQFNGEDNPTVPLEWVHAQFWKESDDKF